MLMIREENPMNRSSTCLGILILLGLAACSGPDPVTPTASPDPAEKSATFELDSTPEGWPPGNGQYWGHYLHGNGEALTRQTHQNAYKLERALWAYIEDNGGAIPRHFRDENPAGKTLYAYLPGKKPLLNPFTLGRTEPQFDTIASTPGQVGIDQIMGSRGGFIGFIVSATGWDGQTIWLYRFLPGYEPPEGPRESTSESR